MLLRDYLERPNLSRLSEEYSQRLYSSKYDALKFSLWEDAISGLFLVTDKDLTNCESK